MFNNVTIIKHTIYYYCTNRNNDEHVGQLSQRVKCMFQLQNCVALRPRRNGALFVRVGAPV